MTRGTGGTGAIVASADLGVDLDDTWTGGTGAIVAGADLGVDLDDTWDWRDWCHCGGCRPRCRPR